MRLADFAGRSVLVDFLGFFAMVFLFGDLIQSIYVRIIGLASPMVKSPEEGK